MRIIVLLVAIFTTLSVYAVPDPDPVLKKIHQAVRTQTSIKIDGELSEMAWQSAPVSRGFTQLEPEPGDMANQESEVRIIYDNKAIYIGAVLKDKNPELILKQLSERDDFQITDWFGVSIDAYQDGQNGVGFYVTPAGVQLDIKYAANGRGRGNSPIFSGDRNWDAVWDSKTKITEEGWVVEMRIPYFAIRFPNQDVQRWNINFARMVRRDREQSFWNTVRPEIEGFLNQSGELTGIKDIKSPFRLSATPFLAYYVDNFHDPADATNDWGNSISGGMDVKYGINDAFTLDMTLVPDFGQTQSDNRVLNLSPFEVRFDENRPFFTEGLELFQKGNLFYSRRVGGRPLRYYEVEDELQQGEEIIDNPGEVRLYNASKVSGRTKEGLGIGVFNATSVSTMATIKNVETGVTRKFETAPLTNYNIFVFDQNLKNNSFISFINTNVWRSGEAYEANVSGTEFRLRDKKNAYAIQGTGAISQKYFTDETDLGYTYNLRLSKTSGKFQYTLARNVESDSYDKNDLGFLRRANERSWWSDTEYNIFKPFGIFNRASVSMFTWYSRLYNPDVFSDFAMTLRSRFITKNFFAFGHFSRFEPIDTYDYFEPRTDDYSLAYRFPKNYLFGGWISSDYRKKIAYDVELSYRTFDEPGRHAFNLELSPRVRVNDHLSFILETELFHVKNDVGYVDELDNGDIIFGRRDRNTFEGLLEAAYAFSNNMTLNLRIRHYWSKATYNSFYKLQPDDTLGFSKYDEYKDSSFNSFNIDMVYRWRFAPGSDIFIVWKNAILGFADEIDTLSDSYFNGLSELNEFPQQNNLSIKIVYFLDYMSLKKA